MKTNTQSLILASLVFTTGAFSSARADGNSAFLNVTMTNNPIVTLNGVEGLFDNITNLSVDLNTSMGALQTDGAGKIEGFAPVYITSTNPAVTFSKTIVTVSGALSTLGTTPSLTLNFKGTGGYSYYQTSSNKLYGSSSLSLLFKSTGVAKSGNTITGITGTVTGTFNSGIKGSKPLSIKTTATLTDIDSTTLLYLSSSLAVANNKATLAGYLYPEMAVFSKLNGSSLHYLPVTGSATGKNKEKSVVISGVTYTTNTTDISASFAAIGYAKGTTMALKLKDVSVDSNSDYSDETWSFISGTGKVIGQSVTATSGNVEFDDDDSMNK
jgi:hypothetical protein